MWSVPLTLVLHGIRVNNADGKGEGWNTGLHHTHIGLTADVGLGPKKATDDGKIREQS